MRKKFYILFVGAMLLFAWGAARAEINSLTFLTDEGAELATYHFSNLDRMTFDGGSVVMHKTSGKTQTHPFSDIKKFILSERSESESLDDNTLDLADGIAVSYDGSSKILRVTATEPLQNLSIVDMSGRTVYYSSPKRCECDIPVANLNPGVHVITVSTANTHKTVKFSAN